MSLIIVPLLFAHGPTPRQFDWPQFLGPSRNGVVEESGWSPAGREEPAWRRNVGLGYSCPTIVGERLVTCGHDAEAERDVVLCLDRTTGDELWHHAFTASDDPSYHGGGTLTTPAVTDGVVYTVNRHGRAHALDLNTGEVVWTRDYKTELELPETFHGYCASPVVEGDRIVLLLGGVMAAVRRADGDLLWRTKDEGDGAYTNPTVFRRGDRALVAAMLSQTFFVIDLSDGGVVHRYEWPLEGNAVHVAQPLVVDDRVLLSTAYGKGSAMLRMGEELEPELLWASRRLRNKVTGVYLHAGHLYGFDESMLKCFDLEGNEQWRVRGLGMGALSIAGGRLLVLSSRGELIVAEANPEEFRELTRAKVLDGGAYWTMPVLVDGMIYVRNSLGDLVCLDHRADGVADVTADSTPGVEAPSAEELFAQHAGEVGAERIRRAHGLQLAGDWEIPGRGQSRTPAKWTFQVPNAWRLGIDSGERVHTFDGQIGWELLNGRARLFDGPEAEEAPSVCLLSEIFAPSLPPGARTLPRPVSFLGQPCWAVESERPSVGPGDSAARILRYYFTVDTRRLVGREGDGISTMAFQGRRAIGAAQVPQQIIIFRVGNGQEETFHVTGGAWMDDPAPPFDRGPGLRRLLRTPEEIARDEELLLERHGDLLGRYQTTDDPGDPEEVAIAIDAGDLVLFARGSRLLLLPLDGATEEFILSGVGATLRILRDEELLVTGADLMFGPEVIHHERLDD